MAADRTSNVCDVCSKPIAINEWFLCGLSIDHPLTDTNRYQLTNFIGFLIIDFYRLDTPGTRSENLTHWLENAVLVDNLQNSKL